MFSYRPPKDSCWGHAIHPKNGFKAIEKADKFFNTYFEPLKPEKLTLNLNPYLDKNNDVPKLKKRADELFGRPGAPESLDWVFPSEDYRRVMDFILASQITPKLPADPIWLSFDCSLTWKAAALPHIESSEGFLGFPNATAASPIFSVNLRVGGRFMFPMGIAIPISPVESASYDFLRRFSSDAPFKMSPKHFQALLPNKRGTRIWKRPDGEIGDRLKEVI